MICEVNPHIGIGAIKLGMGRDEVKKALGVENYSGSNGASDYYFDNAIQVEFEDDMADFIGVSYHPDYLVMYKGVNVFDTEAKDVFELIAANEDEKHLYNPSEFLFPNQIVTLWEADEQYDQIGKESRPIWAQIGVGTSSYLEAVS